MALISIATTTITLRFKYTWHYRTQLFSKAMLFARVVSLRLKAGHLSGPCLVYCDYIRLKRVFRKLYMEYTKRISMQAGVNPRGTHSSFGFRFLSIWVTILKWQFRPIEPLYFKWKSFSIASLPYVLILRILISPHWFSTFPSVFLNRLRH